MLTGVRTGSNLIQVRLDNLAVVLEAVRRLGLVSRTELTMYTRLTPSTITNLVNELLRHDLLTEAGSTASQGGRKRTLLSLHHAARQVVALAVLPDQVKGALVDLGGNIGPSCALELPSEADASTRLDSCAELLVKLGETARDSATPVVGIGIADGCGLRIAERHGSDLQSKLAATQIYVEHATRAAALAETWFGAGAAVDSLAYLSYDQEYTVGLTVERRLFTGAHGQAALLFSNLDTTLTPTTLAAAIKHVAQTYDPDVIVLGGSSLSGMLRQEPDLLNCLSEELKSACACAPHLAMARTGDDAILLGAACLALERFYADPLGEASCASNS